MSKILWPFLYPVYPEIAFALLPSPAPSGLRGHVDRHTGRLTLLAWRHTRCASARCNMIIICQPNIALLVLCQVHRDP